MSCANRGTGLPFFMALAPRCWPLCAFCCLGLRLTLHVLCQSRFIKCWLLECRTAYRCSGLDSMSVLHCPHVLLGVALGFKLIQKTYLLNFINRIRCGVCGTPDQRAFQVHHLRNDAPECSGWLACISISTTGWRVCRL